MKHPRINYACEITRYIVKILPETRHRSVLFPDCVVKNAVNLMKSTVFEKLQHEDVFMSLYPVVVVTIANINLAKCRVIQDGLFLYLDVIL